MAQKYFKANLPKLEKLRIARGWSREDLATEAIISTRTLDSIMAGKSAVLSTLSKLAKALETPVNEIVYGFEEPEQPGGRFWSITIKISAPYDKFDETRDLPEFITKLLERVGGDQILIPEVSKGSTTIRFSLTEEQYLRFESDEKAISREFGILTMIALEYEHSQSSTTDFEHETDEHKTDTEDKPEPETGQTQTS